MLKLAIGITFACILGFAIYLVTYVGFYKSVSIQAPVSIGPLKLLYKDHIGAYHKVVPTIEEVEKWAKENQIDCSKSFGEYIDDPDLIEEERLRARGGCIVPDLPKNIPESFKTFEYPVRTYIVAIFKGAPSIGPFKVYPAVQEYLKKNSLKSAGHVIEQYVIESPKEMTTTYYFPVEANIK